MTETQRTKRDRETGLRNHAPRPRKPARFDLPFWAVLSSVMGLYAAILVALLASLAFYTGPSDLLEAMSSREIRFAAALSLTTSSITAVLSVLVAVPSGYLLSRIRLPGATLIESLLDIPIVLPPMVMGLCLLIFFQTVVGRMIDDVVPFTFTAAGVILAQFMIGAAFAIRTMRGTFDHLSPRAEEVALTLGCDRWQSFWYVALPRARRGILAAGTVAWAHSLGEFGPILVFAGAMRLRTEVLPTTIWLELSAGNLEGAVAVSLLLVVTATLILTLVRVLGLEITSA